METRHERRRRWLLPFALGIVALAPLTGCGGDRGAVAGTTPTTAAPRSLTADFESGAADGWTETARATVTADAAHAGSFGLDLAAAASDAYAALGGAGRPPLLVVAILGPRRFVDARRERRPLHRAQP